MFGQNKAKDKLMISLDADSLSKVASLVDLLKKDVSNFVVGAPLYTACGPDVIRMIQDHGGKAFLDLKYHDIPSTVARAVYQATKLGVAMINIHATGGRRMMAEALAAAKDASGGKPPRRLKLIC